MSADREAALKLAEELEVAFHHCWSLQRDDHGHAYNKGAFIELERTVHKVEAALRAYGAGKGRWIADNAAGSLGKLLGDHARKHLEPAVAAPNWREKLERYEDLMPTNYNAYRADLARDELIAAVEAIEQQLEHEKVDHQHTVDTYRDFIEPKHKAELAQAKAVGEAMEKDAERYRYLREQSAAYKDWKVSRTILNDCEQPERQWLHKKALDVAIDNALQRAKERKP